MAKKDFSNAATNALVRKMTTAPEAAPRPRPAKVAEERVTMILESEAVEKMRSIAWHKKRKLKEVFSEALNLYISQLELEKGTPFETR